METPRPVLAGVTTLAPATAPAAAGSQPFTPAAQATPTPAATPTTPPDYKPLSIQAASCDYGGAFQAIEALDAYTVRFSLCAPDVAFQSKLAFPAFAIYAQEWLAQAASQASSLDLPVGTGPYRLQDWARGEKLAFQAFDGYWRGPVTGPQSLVFRWNLDSTARLVELQAGTADGIDAVSADDFATIRADATQNLLIRPALNVAYLGMNAAHTPLDDERVRQALVLGIDRQQLLSQAFPEGYELADYFAPCVLPYACEGEVWWAFDPQAGRELLAQAGYPDGFQIELAYRDVVRGYLPWPDVVAQNLKDQLAANLKITVKLRSMEDEPFYAAVDAGELPGLYLLGWGADYPDVDNFLSTHFGARASRQFGPPFDDLVTALRQAAATLDPTQRQAQYILANNAIRQHAPVVPLAHGGWISHNARAVAFSKQVQGAAASPLGLDDFSVLSIPGRQDFNWMQPSEPLGMYCAVAADIETLRACAQVAESLLRYTAGGVTVEPGLAKGCVPDDSLQEWTCSLQVGVVFQDGSSLDANDVVASFAAQWQPGARPQGTQAGDFVYFRNFWGNFLP